MNAQDTRPPIFSTKLVVGLAVIALGLILTADSLRWYDAWHLLTWWPLVLAALGLARLVQDGPLSLRGHVWLCFSVAGFISQFGPWGLLERWWPIFLVWGGLIVTLRAIFPQPKRGRKGKDAPPSPSPAVSCDPETDSEQVKP
ncbi:hypothetical protein GETHOR_14960 [Geothrix oryzae]|uniref:LiaI-LiaF-like transmembrane region domain-containing protein n=1 Tax=Geothrix oryzae TaxID=2927975 RepID=A0ABN6V5B0_9BACT|nr:DUF5668 domain-containing protein [Geothrix oryzae]BDU69395.1 hypothetical protein GETHOR_14960 [Geothrix oryzae]